MQQLARSMDVKTDQTMPSCSTMISGPGSRPCSMNTLSIRAVVEPPGRPRASMGIMAPPVAALLPVSEATTPLISPLPKFSGFLDQRRASL